MLFHYIAIDARGYKKEDEIEASSLQAVLSYLNSQGLKPIKVKEAVKKGGLASINIGKEVISLTDKVFLFKYLSLMLGIGTDLFKAIDILIEDFSSGPVRRFLLEARSNLEKGAPFFLSFYNHPEHFSPVVVSLVKAGEASGNLEIVMCQISSDLERERDLRSKIKAALAYPMLLMAVAFAMTFFLVTFLVPKMTQSFLNTGSKIPTYSRIVLSVGNFMNHNVAIILPVLLVGGVALYFFLFKTNAGKKFLNNLGDIVPVVKNLTEKMALERLTSILSSMIKAGMPIIGAIQITADAVANPKFKTALLRIAKDYLPKGVPMGEAFKREKIFPSILTNLMLVGEKAGHTEEILETLSRFYTNEIENSLKTLVAFLEPAMLIIIGVVVGGLALSVIVPVYQMVGQF